MLAVALMVPAAVSPAAPLLVTAAASGGRTLDGDARGGNPFASALIDVLAQPELRLGDALRQMSGLAQGYSFGRQAMQAPALPAAAQVAPLARADGVALVVVFAEYDARSGLTPLPGAAFDAVRVSRAFERGGYRTQMVVAATEAAYRTALAAHERASAQAPVSIIYTTGHGMERDGRISLFAPDGPAGSRMIALDALSASSRAKELNLILYAGCRDDPLRLEPVP